MRILISFIMVLFLASCQQGTEKKETAADGTAVVELKEEVLNIGKMHCQMCVASVEKGLQSVEGVEYVKVSLDDSTAVVRYDSSKTDTEKFKEVVEQRGYILKNRDL